MYVSVRREQESVGENIEGGKGGEEQRGGGVGWYGREGWRCFFAATLPPGKPQGHAQSIYDQLGLSCSSRSVSTPSAKSKPT